MKTIWIVLISFVLTAVIAGGGTYYFANAKAVKDKDNLQAQITTLNTKIADTEKSLADAQAAITTQPISQTTTTTTDATSNWKSITSDRLYFSVKYPSDWVADTTYPYDELPISNSDKSQQVIFQQGNYNTSDLTQCLKSYFGSRFVASKAKNVQSTTGLSGILYDGQGDTGNEKLVMFLYPDSDIAHFPGTKNPLVIINTRYTGDVIPTSQDNIFMGIVNSFRF